MIKDEAVKRNIQISDLGFNKNKIGDMSLTVIKNEVPKEEQPLKPNVETTQSPHGTLPSENSDVPKEEGKIVGIITTSDIVKISSVGSDSEMRKICDQILMRMKNE